MRLSKFLALCGLGSRRKNESLILEGKVLVNGQIVRDLSYKVSPERDQVMVDGKVLKIPPKVYYLFYKPRGYLTSLHDPHHRQTIRAFLEKLPFRVFPVGRLDKDSEGLLLLTNDGDLANQLLHPKYEVRRTYWVWVKPKILENKIKSLLDKGVEIEGKIIKPLEFRFLKKDGPLYIYEVVVKEGVKREVRKMVSFLGGRVKRLLRISFGPLKLKNLQPGEIRSLNKRELQTLRKFLQLKSSEILDRTSSGEST
jgi:23S rRNA pseudouridine2605 synthase